METDYLVATINASLRVCNIIMPYKTHYVKFEFSVK